MSYPLEHIKDLISFVSRLETKDYEDRYLISRKELDQALYQDLVNLEEHGFLRELRYEDDIISATASLGRKLERNKQGLVQFKLELPRSADIFYTDTLDSVISYQSFAWEKPKLLILESPQYNGLSDTTPPDLVKAYHLVIDLIELLVDPKAGNHSNRGNGGFHLYILGSNKKLQMDIKYNSSDLYFGALNKAMTTFGSILSEKAYIGTKYTLLRSTLIDLLMPIPQSDRFRYLLKNITEAATQFRQNYELFLSEFKFENELEKIETAKREYLLGINKVFDDVQNKILAIPASLIIIGGQMNFDSKSELKILVSNSAILIGSILFSWIMVLMTRNQMHTLNAIKSDYTIRKKRIKYQLTDSLLYSELETAFKDVEKRHTKQKRRLWLINGMIVTGLTITVFLFSKTAAYSYLLSKCHVAYTITKDLVMAVVR